MTNQWQVTDDQIFVRDTDLLWWSNLSKKDYLALVQQDQAFFLAMLMDNRESKGLPEKDAVRRARKFMPIFYASLEHRNNEPDSYKGDDAKLPYVLKGRFNLAIPNVVKPMGKERLETASSLNALLRQLMRDNKI